ncbi:hypothetical protein BOTU111921_29385 [Bordetella tumbae]
MPCAAVRVFWSEIAGGGPSHAWRGGVALDADIMLGRRVGKLPAYIDPLRLEFSHVSFIRPRAASGFAGW